MSAEYVWGAIFIMMGVTYISRIIPFLLLAGKPVPRWFKTCTTLVQNLAHLCADSYFRRAGPARRLSARRQPGSGTEQPVPVVDRHHLPAGL